MIDYIDVTQHRCYLNKGELQPWITYKMNSTTCLKMLRETSISLLFQVSEFHSYDTFYKEDIGYVMLDTATEYHGALYVFVQMENILDVHSCRVIPPFELFEALEKKCKITIDGGLFEENIFHCDRMFLSV